MPRAPRLPSCTQRHIHKQMYQNTYIHTQIFIFKYIYIYLYICIYLSVQYQAIITFRKLMSGDDGTASLESTCSMPLHTIARDSIEIYAKISRSSPMYATTMQMIALIKTTQHNANESQFGALPLPIASSLLYWMIITKKQVLHFYCSHT